MDDLISRAEAYTRIAELSRDLLNDDCINLGNASEYLRIIRELPSADRPRGKWIEQEDDYHHYWECSECGMGVGLDDIRNFCPNCGADMRGDTE